MTLPARHHVIHGRDTTALSHPDASPMNRHSLSPALPDLTYILSHRLYSPLRLLALPFSPPGKHILVAAGGRHRTACQGQTGQGRCKSGLGRRESPLARMADRPTVALLPTQSMLFEATQEEEGKEKRSFWSV